MRIFLKKSVSSKHGLLKTKTLIILIILGLGALSLRTFNSQSSSMISNRSTSTPLLEQSLTQKNLEVTGDSFPLFLWGQTSQKTKDNESKKPKTLLQYYLALKFVRDYLKERQNKNKSIVTLIRKKTNKDEFNAAIARIRAALAEDERLRKLEEEMFYRNKNDRDNYTKK